MRNLFKIFSLLLLTAPTFALADKPKPWQMWFQEPASPVMEKLYDFHNFMFVIICIIVAVVLGLLAYICVRFSEKNNPVPSKTSHNTFLEILWTTIPVVILVIIAIPSLRILYYMDKTQDADMTLKVIGYQWYWGYEYPDNGDLSFESYMIQDDDLKPGQLRLLEVDNRIVLPIRKNIRILVTSSDVIHSWAVPSLGVKMDAVPGRLNETWVNINKPGTYYGQCSELCGPYHAFMPIVIEAVSQRKFDAWVRKKRNNLANNNTSDENIRLAISK